MNREGDSYIIGARKNPDGSFDYSRAGILRVNDGVVSDVQAALASALTMEELKSLCFRLSSATELIMKTIVKRVANEKKVPVEQILKEIRQYSKSRIRDRERGDIRHFHRTTIVNLKSAFEMGKLLSRSQLKKEKPEISLSPWSSRDDVMMTRDQFDSDGNLTNPGFSGIEVVGASGNIILVLREKIMDLDNYDSIGVYPTISELPIREYCEAVLVESEEEYQTIQKLLITKDIAIPIYLKSEWKR